MRNKNTVTGGQMKMQVSVLGKFVVCWYKRLPVKRFWVTLATRSEGGDLFSLSLRKSLRTHYGVIFGRYSYGSLAEPGRADALTDIGDYVSIGPGVRRIGAAHPLSELSLHPFWYNPAFGFVTADQDVPRSSCKIESDSWIGADSIILPGCRRIGVGAVIGAGSIVTKDVADFAIMAGNPARQIGSRLTADRRVALLDLKPWSLDPRDVQNALKVIDESKP